MISDSSPKGGSMAADTVQLGFLGAGKMATALARGWIDAGLALPARIVASDPLPSAREAFAAVTGARTTLDNREVVAGCDLLILAVKPQSMPGLLADIRSAVIERQLIVSIAAGVGLKALAEGLGSERRLVRVMPNTPCLVGASAAGYTVGPNATSEDIALVDQLLNAVGRAFRLPEHLLDA